MYVALSINQPLHKPFIAKIKKGYEQRQLMLALLISLNIFMFSKKLIEFVTIKS